MNNIEEFHAYCRMLDIMQAPKWQFIPITREEYDKKYEWLLSIEPSVSSVISMDVEVYVVARASIDGYNFLFVDPSKM